MINETSQPTRSLLYQKQEAQQAVFPALARSFLFPSQRCCRTQNTLRGPRSSIPVKTSKPAQACKPAFMSGHSLFCISQGGVSITERPGAKTTSWLPVGITSRTAIYRPSQARGLPKARKKAALQTAAASSTVEKITQKPALNSVTPSSVFLCYSGAQRSHDKNKLRDKNTARAKRCGHGEGTGMH